MIARCQIRRGINGGRLLPAVGGLARTARDEMAAAARDWNSGSGSPSVARVRTVVRSVFSRTNAAADAGPESHAPGRFSAGDRLPSPCVQTRSFAGESHQPAHRPAAKGPVASVSTIESAATRTTEVSFSTEARDAPARAAERNRAVGLVDPRDAGVAGISRDGAEESAPRSTAERDCPEPGEGSVALPRAPRARASSSHLFDDDPIDDRRDVLFVWRALSDSRHPPHLTILKQVARPAALGLVLA